MLFSISLSLWAKMFSTFVVSIFHSSPHFYDSSLLFGRLRGRALKMQNKFRKDQQTMWPGKTMKLVTASNVAASTLIDVPSAARLCWTPAKRNLSSPEKRGVQKSNHYYSFIKRNSFWLTVFNKVLQRETTISTHPNKVNNFS